MTKSWQIYDYIELLDRDEVFLSMKAAAKKFPHPISQSTLQRLIRYGVRGMHLKTIKIGSRRFTTITAIREFLRATQQTAPERVQTETRTGMSKKMLAELSKKYRLPEPIQK